MLKKTIMLLFFTFKVFAFDINPGISGSWFDQNNSGQGFNIEILSGNRILVYWYAYDQGTQIWLTGVGTYQGNNATINLDQFDGSNFGVNHQAELVNSTPFGSLSLTFQDCNAGIADYSSPAFGSGSIPLNRLTTMPGLECTDDNTQPTSSITSIDGGFQVINAWQAAGGNDRKSFRNHHYTFDVASTEQFDITLNSGDIGSIIWLVDSLDFVLEKTGLSGGRQRIQKTLNPGTYRIVVGTRSSGEVGNYVLRIIGPTDSLGRISSNTEEVVGLWISSGGNNVQSPQNPNYTFDISKRTYIDIKLNSGDIGGRIWLVDSLGFILEKTGLSGGRQRIQKALNPGAYRIVVGTQSSGGGEAGNFVLNINGQFQNFQRQ